MHKYINTGQHVGFLQQGEQSAEAKGETRAMEWKTLTAQDHPCQDARLLSKATLEGPCILYFHLFQLI